MNRFLTFPQRASKRGRRAVALLFVACLALASSCSKDYQPCPDCPGAPALISGKFVLSQVNGMILPYTLPDSSVTFISGEATTTSETFTMSMTTVAKGDTATANTAGVVLPYNKGSVTFHFSPSDIKAQAEINGLGFTLYYNTLTLLFERKG
jgi:hypothetical protein